MIIDITKLRSGICKEILIDEEVNIDKPTLETTEIIELKNTKVTGEIYKDNINNIMIYIKITGIMVLPCSITLEPTDVKIDTLVEGNLLEILKEIDENTKKLENTIDILPIIWENILMEIPMRVVSEKAKGIKLEGEGWKLIEPTEE